MMKNSIEEPKVVQTYSRRSERYDSVVKIFDLFSLMGFDIPAWREAAIRDLHLQPGDTVIDLGCGTGLTFPSLYQAVGPTGRIIGVDISADMLDQAQQSVSENGWPNVELRAIDVSQYDFPVQANGILSTFALILVPEAGQVVSKACQALLPGGRISLLDMAWPENWPLYLRHAFFWLKPFGVTQETLRQKPWEMVWHEMESNLKDVALKRFWFRMMYFVSGAHP
jgi:demethylmenaquinone methyltransferase/2-methoxy-6-polyprenyl-1,4-benzoquinol methylase